jgi:hypothetical protein
MYFLGNGSNRIITKKAQIDTFQELATGDSVWREVRRAWDCEGVGESQRDRHDCAAG